MVVTRENFDEVVEMLTTRYQIALDTETTGLRPYHGDRIFSIILAADLNSPFCTDRQAYYFNFWPSYEGLDPKNVLNAEHLKKLERLWSDPKITWNMHNALFDLHMLKQEGIELAGKIWCTLTQARLEYNEHMNYDLDACLKRIGRAKDDAVEKWIEDNKAWEWTTIPGKKQRVKNKFYVKVPWDIIVPYGLSDALGTLALGEDQRASIAAQAREYPSNALSPVDACHVEMQLSKTILRMENRGVKIDRKYCVRAGAYEADRAQKAELAFQRETGKPFEDSRPLFQAVFGEDRELWGVTDKGNPSFDSDSLKAFKNPAAKFVLEYRDAKAKLNFYNGFLWHADENDVIHPNFKSGGTRTFRLSSAGPNLQNLTSEDPTYCRTCKEWIEQFTDTCPECQGGDIEHPEFLVRRAIIPRPGFVFFLPDYDQMEYKMMLDYAVKMMTRVLEDSRQPYSPEFFDVANKVRDGFDVHKATADELNRRGVRWVKRKHAKAINFGLLYGQGEELLAASLGVTREEAKQIKSAYFAALPYVRHMIQTIGEAVRERGWIRNWAGYKYHFPDRSFGYKGPNTIIQGGCAAVVKIAMNRIDEYLEPMKSKMVLTIHDELPCEIHESEIHIAPKAIVERMQTVYPYKHIQLTAGAEWSAKSLADKQKGYPA